jgi:predicted RNA binding protein YcfA (HicA-like mRNA interferase family)
LAPRGFQRRLLVVATEWTATIRVYGVYVWHMNSRELIAELIAAGWRLGRVNGSHHRFKHPTKLGTLVVPHPKNDLGKGLVQALRRHAT